MYTFSGIDSSGKTTQINLLKQYCEENNIKYHYHWSKGRATPFVMFLKKVFRRDKKMDDGEKKEYRKKFYKSKKKKRILLFFSITDLIWYWGIYYRFLKMRHKFLICDRYIWDTYIDFVTEFPEFNINKWIIWKIAKKLAPKPNCSFVFIISANESYKRDLLKGDIAPDSIERKKEKIQQYEKLILLQKWQVVIDGMKTKEDIFEVIKENVL